MKNKIKLLEQIILDLPNYVFWKDNTLIYRLCNKNFAYSAGFDHVSDVIGKSDEEMPWDDASTSVYRQEDLHILATGEDILNKEVQMTFQNSKEKPHILSISKTPLYDDEQIVGILGIYIDITKEKQAELAKSDFISDMEHDFRTPFIGIGGGVRTLTALSEFKYPEMKDNYPDFIEILGMMLPSCEQWENTHTRVLNTMLLDHSTPVRNEPTSISGELKKIIEMMNPTFMLKKIKCILDPIPAHWDIINTDSLKLHLILLDIIGNAAKFTEQGEIHIYVTHEAKYCLIHIKDTGIGIPADKLNYIFEKYTKLSRSNKHQSFQGAGIGLYNAEQVIQQLGGSISVKSTLGKGSIFSVKIPRVC